jgi:hypothetical protein
LFVDPFDAAKIHQTAPTEQIFESLVDAQGKMGFLDRITSSSQYSLDPGGREGVMLMGDRSAHFLLAFTEGEPLELYSGVEELGLRNLVNVVSSRGSLVAAFLVGDRLLVMRLTGGTLSQLAELSAGESGEREIALVRTEAGDLGVAMNGDDGVFVYPLSETGELGEAIFAPLFQSRPPVCDPAASGFVVERELKVTPFLESANSGSALSIARMRARYIIGYNPPSLVGLAGFARALESPPPKTPKKESVSLSVINTDADGERLGLLCE